MSKYVPVFLPLYVCMLMTIVIYETGTDCSGKTYFISLGTYESHYNEGLMEHKYGEFMEFSNPSAETETTPTKGTTSSSFKHKQRNEQIVSLNPGCTFFTLNLFNSTFLRCKAKTVAKQGIEKCKGH